MSDVLTRLQEAIDSHDPERLASCFAEGYRSAQPIHSEPGVRRPRPGAGELESVFTGVPDFSATLMSSTVDGDTVWGEWDWRGRHADGSSFAMRGVTVFVARDGLIVEGRLYMEPVDAGDADIDAAVQQLYKPPPGSAD